MDSFDLSFALKTIPKLLPYLRITTAVMFGSIFYGLVTGSILARICLDKNKAIRRTGFAIINMIRCTPGIIMVYIIYYGLPKVFQLFGHNISNIPRFIFMIFALGILFSASAAEILRSAFLSISEGQFEAAITIGLTNFQAYRRIVFPQLIAITLPNFGNSFIALLKEGSLAYLIGVIDIMGQGNLIIARLYGTHAVEVYTALLVIYLVLTFILDRFFILLEKKFGRGRRETAHA